MMVSFYTEHYKKMNIYVFSAFARYDLEPQLTTNSIDATHVFSLFDLVSDIVL